MRNRYRPWFDGPRYWLTYVARSYEEQIEMMFGRDGPYGPPKEDPRVSLLAAELDRMTARRESIWRLLREVTERPTPS